MFRPPSPPPPISGWTIPLPYCLMHTILNISIFPFLCMHVCLHWCLPLLFIAEYLVCWSSTICLSQNTMQYTQMNIYYFVYTIIDNICTCYSIKIIVQCIQEKKRHGPLNPKRGRGDKTLVVRPQMFLKPQWAPYIHTSTKLQ